MLKTTTHKEQSHVYLAQAFEELAEGDLPQASEKGWGAATQMLKAIAEERGWSHKNHRDVYTVMRDLRRETDDPEISADFSAAESLHGNFYEINLEFDTVEDYLRQVERLVGKVERLLDGPA